MLQQSSVVAQLSKQDLADMLYPGDLLFIRVSSPLFSQVAEITGSWTNHVGVAVQGRHGKLCIAESRIPLTCLTAPSRFVQRSAGQRVAILRLPGKLTVAQTRRLCAAVRLRLGTPYDAGFNFRSRRQFCSRFAHEVLLAATGQALGEVQTFRELLLSNPGADLAFWKFWYFRRIPWSRLTLTPASLLTSPRLQTVFDGAMSYPRTARGL